MPIIKVDNLSKKYILSHQQQESYTALRDVITNKFKGIGRSLSRSFSSRSSTLPPNKEDFWALKNISFEIEQGDRVGIIGRNGAGKSTLLKILSRITEPTSGKIGINGRIASLLEVGTGFHPELTGRENIFLNGAILGMTRVEIKQKFDEIVAFAEVEKFLDTPVKHYSSGMYVRLAFSVAAHLEPEILLVDEVLAVGDASFQKKCLGKMGEVGKEGRTVLFVSHNMAAIQKLCTSSLLLDHGRIIKHGSNSEVINDYLKHSFEDARISLAERKDRQGNGDIRFVYFALQNEQGQAVSAINSGDNVKFIIGFENQCIRELRNLIVSVGIDNQMGDRITVISNEISGEVFDLVPTETNKIEIMVNRLPLTGGNYGFTLFASANGVILDWIQNAGHFNVSSGDFYRSGKVSSSDQGNFLLDYKYSTNSDLS